MTRFVILALVILLVGGCARFSDAARAERFCTGIGIPKGDPRFQECAIRHAESRNQGQPYNWQLGVSQGLQMMEAGAPRTLGGPAVTCHQIGTMTQSY